MRKSFILLAIIMATTVGLRAQSTQLTQAVDFTATDCHGNEIHLFDILDRGQAVFIDFFFYTCGQCQVISPYITGAYTATGCNQHDVFFMEISYIDNNDVCQQWANQYGVEFPTIGREGGGNEIFNLYGIMGCPTLILIKPDRSITIQGYQQLYPFSTNDVINALAQYGGIQQHDCNTTGNDEIDITDNITVFPNPVNNELTITAENLSDIVIYNTLGQNVGTFHTNEKSLKVNTANFDNGIYLVKINGCQTKRIVVSHE